MATPRNALKGLARRVHGIGPARRVEIALSRDGAQTTGPPSGSIPSETDLRRIIPGITATQAVAAAPATMLRVAEPEKELVRRSVIGLTLVIVAIAASWIAYSQLLSISMPSAVPTKSLTPMARLGIPLPMSPPAAAALGD